MKGFLTVPFSNWVKIDDKWHDIKIIQCANELELYIDGKKLEKNIKLKPWRK